MTPSRSFQSVMAFVTLIITLLGFLPSCVNPNTSDDPSTLVLEPTEQVDSGTNNQFTEEEVMAIVEEIQNGNVSVLEGYTNEELEALVDAFQEYGVSLSDLDTDGNDESTDPPPPPSGLSACSGYWGAHWNHEYIERWDTSSGWLLYYTGPNCVMWAPGSDCGTDYDDYMLSFYFGNHAESLTTLQPMLRWSSSNALVELLLGTVEGRVYEQTKGGARDNYNIYICIDDGFGGYLETIKMNKYTY